MKPELQTTGTVTKGFCLQSGLGLRATGRAVCLTGLLLAGVPNLLRAQTNGILREVYLGISGTAIADLTNSPSFPN